MASQFCSTSVMHLASEELEECPSVVRGQPLDLVVNAVAGVWCGVAFILEDCHGNRFQAADTDITDKGPKMLHGTLAGGVPPAVQSLVVRPDPLREHESAPAP